MWSLFLHSLFDIDTNILKDNDHLFNQGSNLNLQNFLDTTLLLKYESYFVCDLCGILVQSQNGSIHHTQVSAGVLAVIS